MDNYVYYYEENLYVNLTNRCSNACEFCLRKNGDGVAEDNLWLKREGSKEEIADLIKNYDKPYGDVVFCGYGESTYRLDDMLYIADVVHSIGKKTRLNTNGLGNLINGKDIVPLLNGKIDAVSISLNQKDAYSYQKISCSEFGERSFDELIKFTRSCVNEKINTTLTVVDVISDEDIEECRKIAQQIGCNFRVRKYIS